MKKIFSVLLVFYTLLGFVVIPYTVQSYAPKVFKNFIDSKGYVGSVFFNPFTFELEVNNFLLKDKKGETLLFFKSVYLDLNPINLLNNELMIKNFKINNLSINIAIDIKKQTNFQYIIDYLAKDSHTTEEEQEPQPSSLHIVIGDFELTKTILSFKDYSKEIPFTVTTKAIDFSMNNIRTTPNHVNKVALEVTTIDLGKIRLKSNFRLSPLSVDGDFMLKNFNVNKVFDYVKNEDMDFTIDSQPLSLSFVYKYKADKEKQYIEIGNSKLDIESAVFIQDRYKVNITQFHNDVNKINLTLDDNISYSIDTITTTLNSLVLYDKTVKLPFRDIQNTIHNVTDDKSQVIEVLHSTLMPSQGKINTIIKVRPEPLSLNAKTEIEKVDIVPYKPYMQEFVNLDVKSSYLSMYSDVNISKRDTYTDVLAKLNLSVDTIDIANSVAKEQLLFMKSLDVNNLLYKNDNLFIDTITLTSPKISYSQTGEKFKNIVIAKDTNTTQQKQTKEKDFTYLVNKIAIRDAQFTFIDSSIDISMVFDKINSDISPISSSSDTMTNFQLASVLDKYSSIESNAKFFVLKPFKSTTFHTIVNNVDLVSFSPYSAKYIGSKTKNGKLNIALDYNVSQSQLQSKNHISIQDLELGERVESKDVVKAPIGLAIGLLKDSKGNIVLDVPIEGDVSKPNFHIGDVIRNAITNIILNIASSPFSFLGSVMGFDGESISSIEFNHGSAKVILAQQEKLDKIIKILKAKPNLTLHIKPSYVNKEDGDVIRKRNPKVSQSILVKELQKLAKQRVASIQKYLVGKGMALENIKIDKKMDVNSAVVKLEVSVQ